MNERMILLIAGSDECHACKWYLPTRLIKTTRTKNGTTKRFFRELYTACSEEHLEALMTQHEATVVIA